MLYALIMLDNFLIEDSKSVINEIGHTSTIYIANDRAIKSKIMTEDDHEWTIAIENGIFQ